MIVNVGATVTRMPISRHRLGGYAVDLDKQVFEGAPSYKADWPVDLTDVA